MDSQTQLSVTPGEDSAKVTIFLLKSLHIQMPP